MGHANLTNFRKKRNSDLQINDKISRGGVNLVSGSFLITLVAALLFPLLYVTSASAATKTIVTSTFSSTLVNSGNSIAVSGRASGRTAKAKVILQRKHGSKWVTVSSSKVSGKGTYYFKTQPPTGKHYHRVYVYKTKKSAAGYGSTTLVEAEMLTAPNVVVQGSKVVILAQSPYKATLSGKIQRLDGKKWVNVTNFKTSSSGTIKSSATIYANTYVRVYIPKQKVKKRTYGSWVSVSAKVDSTPPVMSEAQATILADINQVRANAGKAPLVLDHQISGVAYNWSKYLHDSGKFYHNPNYSKQIRDGWTRAGENIAAGQDLDEVVEAWRNSPGHYTNMIGDYTHIGIGVYNGTKGYDRYYTTNFGKY